MSNIFNRLFSNTIVFGIGTAFQSISMFFVLPIITSYTTIDQFGVYGLLLAVSTVSNGVFYFGMASALPRFYYQFKSEQNKQRIFNIGYTVTILGALLQIVFFSTVSFFKPIENYLNYELSQASYIYLAIASSAFMLNQYLLLYLRLDNRPVMFVIINAIYSIALAGSLILFLNDKHEPVTQIFKAMLLSSLLTLTITFFAITNQKVYLTKFKLSASINRKILIFGFFQVIASFGQSLSETIDRFLISGILDMQDVGLYFAHTRAAAIIHIIFCVPFALVWSTVSMEIIHHANRSIIIQKTLKIYVLVGFLMASVIGLISGELFSLFFNNQNIKIDYFIFSNLCTSILLAGAMTIVSVGLFYEQQIKKLAIIVYIVALSKGLILSVLLPIFGLAGAAIGSLSANILLLFLCNFVAMPKNKILLNWSHLIFGTMVYIISQFVIFNYLIDWDINLKLMCIFLIVLISFGGFRKFLILN